nr:IS5 family transposase [Paracoccus kondratievae]
MSASQASVLSTEACEAETKRYELSDGQWDRIASLLAGKAGDPGRTGADSRIFINGCLWVLRSGTHWRDLPDRYGKWTTVHKRFSRWRHAGIREQVFKTLTADRDNQYLMIDCAIVRAHQQAASGKGGRDQAPGRSRGGLTTRIHMLADALGRPSRFIITAGLVGDITQVSSLPQGQSGDLVLADKAYSNALRQIIASIGAEAVIPSNGLRKIIIPHDERACAHRNHIGRCFSQMKLFRRFASRYDRRAVYFRGFVCLVAAMPRMR